MTQIPQLLFGAYIPPQPVSEHTSIFGIVLYGIGCILSLVAMFAWIRKTRRDKLRQKRSEKIQ